MLIELFINRYSIINNTHFGVFQHMKSLQQLFNRQYEEKARLLSHFQQIVDETLPEILLAHCQVANYSNSVLTVVVDSPVWAARFKIQQKSIISLMSNKSNSPIEAIKVLIKQPNTSPKKEKVAKSRHLSRQSAESIKASAEYINDQELKEALLNLAKRGR